MADRNERHFLEFYTPARQRLAARRQTNTERPQPQITPFSDDKENPSKDDFGAIPATIPGEKAVGIGRQRRRLFTRSASKKKYADVDHGSNDESNDVNLTNLMTPQSEFSSPPVSGSTLSRALFSADGNSTPMTGAIHENDVSPNFYSPPGSSNLLKEYRSKQSLLSSSKTRPSSFSSPLSGGLRLRPSSLWKRGKRDKINEEDLATNADDNPLVAAIERSQTKPLETDPTDVETTASACQSLQNDSPSDTLTNLIEGTTPTSATLSPMTPKTTSRRSGFWSPPGTSRLLRKYRQRTQQLDEDESTFQSPPNANIVLYANYGRSRTTPRGRKGLRLLDSGAKRCRNNRLSLRPRPAANEVTTPTNSKIRASVKASVKPKDSTVAVTANANRGLLSPSTAKRLNQDINSYRQAHGREKLPHPVSVAEKDSPLLVEEAQIESDKKYNTEGSNRDSNEKCADHGALEMSPYTQFLPALSASGHAADTTNNESIADSLPFDEHNAENLLINSGTPLSMNESSIQADATEGTSRNKSKSPEAVTTNPSDEDETETGVFRSTRSASRARRKSPCDVVKAASFPDATEVDKVKGEEKEEGVFRSTRSASRARRESVRDKVKSEASTDATRENSKDETAEVGGAFRATRSASRARRKPSTHEVETSTAADATPADSKDDPNEDSDVFRSIGSATRARRKTVHELVKAGTDSAATLVDFKNDDEGSGIFRSTRSSTRAHRKSLHDVEKAISFVESAIASKSTNNAIDSSLVVEVVSCADSKSDLTSPLPIQSGIETPSSKGSLQSIWDVLHCGGGENSIDSTSSENRCDSGSVHANIVSRVGDCVNPMASTLMNMWREEEKGANGEIDTLPLPVCGLKTPPPKSFSTDLKLVYGLERVQNLTLARPKPLQATRSMTGESSSTASQGIIIPPLAPCSQ